MKPETISKFWFPLLLLATVGLIIWVVGTKDANETKSGIHVETFTGDLNVSYHNVDELKEDAQLIAEIYVDSARGVNHLGFVFTLADVRTQKRMGVPPIGWYS